MSYSEMFSKTNMDATCPSCGGQLDFFMTSQYHCWDCGNVYDPSQVGMNTGATPSLIDDELNILIEDYKLDSKPKLKCPDCNSTFVKEGIKLFTSIEPNKCGNCGKEWDPE